MTDKSKNLLTNISASPYVVPLGALEKEGSLQGGLLLPGNSVEVKPEFFDGAIFKRRAAADELLRGNAPARVPSGGAEVATLKATVLDLEAKLAVKAEELAKAQAEIAELKKPAAPKG